MKKAAKLVSVALALTIVLLVFSRTRPSSLAHLKADAEAVPVPQGVAFTTEGQSSEDGSGFTTKKFDQVSRQYSSTLPCDALERTWADALHGADRRFEIANYPNAFGASGSLGIRITDRTHPLGITIGNDAGHCNRPFVYSFNQPH